VAEAETRANTIGRRDLAASKLACEVGHIPRTASAHHNRPALESGQKADSMKISLFFRDMQQTAEHELALRFVIAGQACGYDVTLCSSSSQILEIDPDIVLAFHSNFPKLTHHPTYGCMWNPPIFFGNTPSTLRNILSYDGYLFGGGGISQYIEDLDFGLRKEYFSGEMYPSCQSTAFAAARYENAQLAIVGTNWDGPRFELLFRALSASGLASFFGPQGAWDHVGDAYAGSIAFDGRSVLQQLNRSGITLALHREEHLAAGTPNMRLFEGIAASSIIITDNFQFAGPDFGDSLLYIDRSLPPEYLAEQILDHVLWVRENPERACEMAAAAHGIFLEKYSLEVGLEQLVSAHSKTGREASVRVGKPGLPNEPKRRSIDCVVRSGLRDVGLLRRALESLRRQTVNADIRVILVNNGPSTAVANTVSALGSEMTIEEIVVAPIQNRGHSLWSGLHRVESEFFCLLDDDDIIHPDHLRILLATLDKDLAASVAYSGAIRVIENTEGKPEEECRSLAFLDEYDRNRLLRGENFITSNSFLARSSALKSFCREDAGLVVLEDLWLLICLSRHGHFIPSWRATSEFYQRVRGDNISHQAGLFHQAADRIRTRLQFSGLLNNDQHDQPTLQFQRDLSHSPATSQYHVVHFSKPTSTTSLPGGNIDKVRFFDDHVEIEGWLPINARSKRSEIFVDGEPSGKLLEFEEIKRPDVARAHRNWALFRSGFFLSFGTDGASCRPLDLYFSADEESLYRLERSHRIDSLLQRGFADAPRNSD